jgi:hypothetical protein
MLKNLAVKLFMELKCSFIKHLNKWSYFVVVKLKDNYLKKYIFENILTIIILKH